MKPNFEIAKGSQSFHQCVGLDMAKKKFNACLCMYDTISGSRCYTKSVEFSNDKTGHLRTNYLFDTKHINRDSFWETDFDLEKLDKEIKSAIQTSRR